MKRILTFMGCLFAAAAYAAPTTNTYDVEMLVFENKLPELEGGELWTRDKARTLIADIGEAVTVEDSSSAGPTLDNAAAALEREGTYRVLVRQRWRQTAEERSATKPVRLHTADGRLDGALRFYMSRFLHVDLDVVMQDQSGKSPDLSYRISEHRRIKTQDLNYFDHPKFGALLRVIPVGKE